MRVPTLSKYIHYIHARSIKGINGWRQKNYYDILNFNKFWQSTPILAHFVPCKDGVPLEKPPQKPELPMLGNEILNKDWHKKHGKNWGEYQEAESRLRWVGFKAYAPERFKENGGVYIIINDVKYWWSDTTKRLQHHNTYESIITANIPLEPVEGYAKTLNI